MSKKLISGALTLAIGLTVASSAFAGSPSRTGYRDSRSIASCEDSRESGTSYRDVASRSQDRASGVIAAGSNGYRGQFAAASEQQAVRAFAKSMGLACSG